MDRGRGGEELTPGSPDAPGVSARGAGPGTLPPLAGRGGRAPRHDLRLVRWLFLRALGVVLLIAFASLRVQVLGLVGSDGILPAQETIASLRSQLPLARAVAVLPTLGWISASDAALVAFCDLGIASSLLVVAGLATRLALFACWVLYLSLYHLGGDFLGFQWDLLLLETTFLGWLLAPWTRLERPRGGPPASRVATWLLRLLLWKLVFFSGWVKLPYPTWTGLRALDFHYETQPLPNVVAWWAHRLPHWFQACSVAATFAVELVAPWLLFAGRRARALGAASITILMLLIVTTGNYNFFNLLTIALCLTWLDDDLVLGLLPEGLRARLSSGPRPADPAVGSRTRPRVPPIATVVVAVVWLGLLAAQTTALFAGYGALPGGLRSALVAAQPFALCNPYGLFRNMTTERDEIELEASMDGTDWRPYVFRWKPGDPRRAPGWCEPHQPRLDWQMWFAALSRPQRETWFRRLVVQLLRGSKPVESLFESVPFPDAPPRFVRARFWRYRFSTSEERERAGAWWVREPLGDYLEPVSLQREASGGPSR